MQWNEYEKVEMFLREVATTGVVCGGESREDMVAACFRKYKDAKATVLSNKPSVYSTYLSGTGNVQRGKDGGELV